MEVLSVLAVKFVFRRPVVHARLIVGQAAESKRLT